MKLIKFIKIYELNQINFISPYAKILGLDVIRVESIKQLEEMNDAK